MASISSDVPPPGGCQSSHPTLPGPFLHSGMVNGMLKYVGSPQIEGGTAGVMSPLPSQVTTFSGMVTGRIAQSEADGHTPSM